MKKMENQIPDFVSEILQTGCYIRADLGLRFAGRRLCGSRARTDGDLGETRRAQPSEEGGGGAAADDHI